jgi:hypothetical protein
MVLNNTLESMCVFGKSREIVSVFVLAFKRGKARKKK